MNQGFCNICEQRLTDASGSWSIDIRARGLFMDRTRDARIMCCSACQADIMEKIEELIEKQGGKQWKN